MNDAELIDGLDPVYGDKAHRCMTNSQELVERLTRPVAGIEKRSAQEAFSASPAKSEG